MSDDRSGCQASFVGFRFWGLESRTSVCHSFWISGLGFGVWRLERRDAEGLYHPRQTKGGGVSGFDSQFSVLGCRISCLFSRMWGFGLRTGLERRNAEALDHARQTEGGAAPVAVRLAPHELLHRRRNLGEVTWFRDSGERDLEFGVQGLRFGVPVEG